MARAMPREAVPGENLRSRLEAGERFGQAQLLNLLRAVGDELADAHRDGRFHGTITPADIGFDAAGEVELTGWGRDTTPDVTRASPYAAIECYAPVHPQGPWTDVYALGALLWQAITGAPPAEVLHRKGDVTLERLAPPGFDPVFLRAVDAALEIAPQRRPPSVEHWLAMFGPAGTAVGAAPPVPEPPPPPKRAWRVGWRWPAFASLFAGLGAVSLIFPTDRRPDPVGPETTPAPAPPPVTATAAPTPPPEPAEASAAPPPETAPPEAPPLAAPAAAERPRPPKVDASPPPVAKPTPAPAPAASGPEPPVEAGEAPRTLLVRADKRLRRLFDDYARTRARIERSYDDSDLLYGAKLRAYRESRRIQRELVELRDLRNRLARTGDFRTANRRYDELDAAAAQLSARMEAVRESL